MSQGFQAGGRLDNAEWVTDPLVNDPENLPVPLGWTILVRPYPVQEKTQGGIILSTDDRNMMANITNIGRVVSIGKCAWNRPNHRDPQGKQFNWVEVGDFVAYPKHVGAKRKFKGVSFVVLNDDEITDFLPDPQVFNESGVKLDIPEEHLIKYNTIYNANFVTRGV